MSRMVDDTIVVRSHSLVGLDNATVRVEETLEGDQVVLSIARSGGSVQTVRLSEAMFGAIFGLKYEIRWKRSVRKENVPVDISELEGL